MEAQTRPCLLNVKFITTKSRCNAAYFIFNHQYNVDVVNLYIWQVVKHWHDYCWLSFCLSISHFSSVSIHQNNNTENCPQISVHTMWRRPHWTSPMWALSVGICLLESRRGSKWPKDYVKQRRSKCRHLHKDNEMLRPVSWHYVGGF